MYKDGNNARARLRCTCSNVSRTCFMLCGISVELVMSRHPIVHCTKRYQSHTNVDCLPMYISIHCDLDVKCRGKHATQSLVWASLFSKGEGGRGRTALVATVLTKRIPQQMTKLTIRQGRAPGLSLSALNSTQHLFFLHTHTISRAVPQSKQHGFRATGSPATANLSHTWLFIYFSITSTFYKVEVGKNCVELSKMGVASNVRGVCVSRNITLYTDIR